VRGTGALRMQKCFSQAKLRHTLFVARGSSMNRAALPISPAMSRFIVSGQPTPLRLPEIDFQG